MATVFSGWVWRDSGWFGLLLVGVPVLCCLLAVVADATGYRTAMMTTAAAVGMLLWSLLNSGGLGLYFLGPAILLAAAASTTTWQRERQARAGVGSVPGTEMSNVQADAGIQEPRWEQNLRRAALAVLASVGATAVVIAAYSVYLITYPFAWVFLVSALAVLLVVAVLTFSLLSTARARDQLGHVSHK